MKETKYLIPTCKGKELIAVLPDDICSPLFTARWEQDLLEIEKGLQSSDDFMRDIGGMMAELVHRYDDVPTAPGRYTGRIGYRYGKRRG